MINAERHSQWLYRLQSFFNGAEHRPFEWGKWDCCTGLACPAVHAILDVDLGAPYRGTYSTALGALKALKKQGYDSLVDLAAANFQRQELCGAVGDLAAIKTDGTGWSLGVVVGSRIAVLTPVGFGTIDPLKADHGYKVG
jgi:hypothetical protein